MLVWSMCEWSGFYSIGKCECQFGQCASGPVVMCEWKCPSEMECASASLVNVRVVRFLQSQNARLLVCSMCEWSGFYKTEVYEC